MRTEEHERRLIAADLHDNVGQSLALARLQITAAQRDLPAEHPLMTSLANISQTLLRTIQDTRHLIFELSSPTLNELGLGPAIAEWTEQQAASWPELKVEVIDQTKPLDLNADLRAMLFRNTRELITNVIKHAQANCLSIWLDREDDELVITIQDDGVGFDPARISCVANPEGGYGLFSIQERMTDLGGSLTLVSQPGAGCKAILRLPLNLDTMPA
jgi:signal transduction histidine kinase